jgi:DNA-directed RNA polymerase alpha subunit
MKELNKTLQRVAKEGKVRFPVIESKEFLQTSVDALDLDARSSNSLKRTKIYTVEDILMNKNELHKIRGCGSKSISRIMYGICVYHYLHLAEQEKKTYLEELIKLNED